MMRKQTTTMTLSIFLYCLFLVTSTTLAAPQSGPMYRSSVDLKNMKEGYISSDVSKVLSRFEDTLNGVNRPRSYYGSRSNSVGGGSDSVESSPASASSTLSALLRILDRLQDVDSTQELTSNTFTNSPVEKSVDNAYRLINKTLPVVGNVTKEVVAIQTSLESTSTESETQKSAEESDEKISNESEIEADAVKSGNDSAIENVEFRNFANFTIKDLVETTSEVPMASTKTANESGTNFLSKTKNSEVNDEKAANKTSIKTEENSANKTSIKTDENSANKTSIKAEEKSAVSTENSRIILHTDFENVLNDSVIEIEGGAENLSLVEEAAAVAEFSNETVVNGSVLEGLKDTSVYDGSNDPSSDDIEERYRAFVPSQELLNMITHSPEFENYDPNDDENRQSLDLIAEPISEEANRTANVTEELNSLDQEPFEMTTLSGEEFFSAKPFLENLVNQTTITEEDLSTVASIAISQSAIATSSALSEDDPNFIFTRNSGSLIQMKTCVFNGVRYVSGQNIDQSDPCHFCVCVDGDVSCYWKNCPPAPDGCADLDFEGVCHRSLYLCPIPVKGQPLPFADNNIKRIHKRQSETGSGNFNLTCDILGVEYKVGELVGVASDPCMECRCAIDSLYCSPKCCFQPTVDQQTPIGSELDQDPSKNARAEDPVWFPVLANPLMHLRSEFENQQK